MSKSCGHSGAGKFVQEPCGSLQLHALDLRLPSTRHLRTYILPIFPTSKETICPSPTSSSEDTAVSQLFLSVSVELDSGEGRGTREKRETNKQKN